MGELNRYVQSPGGNCQAKRQCPKLPSPKHECRGDKRNQDYSARGGIEKKRDIAAPHGDHRCQLNVVREWRVYCDDSGMAIARSWPNRYGNVKRRSIKGILLLVKEIPVEESTPNYRADAVTPGESRDAMCMAPPVNDLDRARNYVEQHYDPA